MLCLAGVFYRKYRYLEALQCCERALAIDPLYTEALDGLVTILRDSYRYEDAERAAVEAVGEGAAYPQSDVLHGWALSDVDRDDEAVAAAERALAIDPRHSWALTSRIDFLKYLRRYEDAERAAAEALELADLMTPASTSPLAGCITILTGTRRHSMPSSGPGD